MSEAAMTRAMVSTGSANWRSAARGSSQPRAGKPLDGTSRNCTANSVTSRMPIQNTGTAMPSCEAMEMRPPYQRRRFTAARMPSGSARAMAETKASSVSGSVTVRRRPISSITGTPETKEAPRSKRARAATKRTNCSASGRSEPTWRRAASICAASAPTDTSALAGSPGKRRSRTNSTAMAISTEAARMAVRRMR